MFHKFLTEYFYFKRKLVLCRADIRNTKMFFHIIVILVMIVVYALFNQML